MHVGVNAVVADLRVSVCGGRIIQWHIVFYILYFQTATKRKGISNFIFSERRLVAVHCIQFTWIAFLTNSVLSFADVHRTITSHKYGLLFNLARWRERQRESKKDFVAVIRGATSYSSFGCYCCWCSHCLILIRKHNDSSFPLYFSHLRVHCTFFCKLFDNIVIFH